MTAAGYTDRDRAASAELGGPVTKPSYVVGNGKAAQARELGYSALYLGVVGLIVSLLMLGFFTQTPALLAYLVSFLVATVLGCGSFYLGRGGKKSFSGKSFRGESVTGR